MIPVRVDVLIVVTWVSAIFIKITYFLYVANLALVQSFKLSTLNKTILPLGFLGTALSVFLFTTTTETYNFIDKTWPVYAMTMEFIIPAILLAIAVLRRLP